MHREDFPILNQVVHGKPLVYLDNAATTQKPQFVLDASKRYYDQVNANIHRGTHYLARLATDEFEAARTIIAERIGAKRREEVIFTSGCTHGINLVANILQLGGKVKAGDEIMISTLEHHSNIVPWQMLCERTGAILKIIPCDEEGILDQDAYAAMLNERTVVVAVTWVSNAFGTVNPIVQMIAQARKTNALVLIDAAQAIAHEKVDVVALDADFLVFSGHKVYASTGIGVLWGKAEVLDALPPWCGGGEMIERVSFEKTSYNQLPFKYEAGTPHIEGAISLGAAFEYIATIGMDRIIEQETKLIRAAEEALKGIEGIRLFGPENRISSLSFQIGRIHHYDLGTLLDQMGVAVRTGHHCCQPLMQRFGISGTTRASFAFYNTEEEIEVFADSVQRAVRLLL